MDFPEFPAGIDKAARGSPVGSQLRAGGTRARSCKLELGTGPRFNARNKARGLKRQPKGKLQCLIIQASPEFADGPEIFHAGMEFSSCRTSRTAAAESQRDSISQPSIARNELR